jgi:hypothetical protein
VIDRHIVWNTAEIYKVPFEVVAAVILQESSGYQFATRHEDRWFTKNIVWRTRAQLSGYIPPEEKCTLITEKRLRATSFGYMQILGETARSILKFKGDSLIELVDREINLELGCQLLRRNYDKAILNGLTNTDALRLSLKQYNGSWKYVEEVEQKIKSKAYEKILI